ncbi:hypothetical protein LTR36_005707 [Oleoguttula mirabilis]|uniref:Fork-head domain-containing protein n=1 Tax=Oleoguttula mirabilis TaxID=1507867 RepID=A0AAV9JDU4_9PEZI|nr:hypothetical protein LTR36_005707 [Oleoguttula mirabilis]
MEVHAGSWASFDHPPVTSPPCDQGMLQPHQQPQQSRQSQSHDAEWQKIFEELEAGSGGLNHDFDMFNPSSATSAPMHHSPVQSIETYSAPEREPQMSAGSSGSSSFSYVQQPEHPYHPLWPTTSAPASAYPPAIPENEQWGVPQPHHYSQPPMMQNTWHHNMHVYESTDCHPQQAHHLLAGPSPFLSEGSPFHQEVMDEGWDQPEMQQQYLDGSNSDEINDADAADPCYAQLLYRCLKEAPDHILSLRELYDWVREHSQKAKDPKNRGWQNSVRHNLSMNAAFERVPPSQSQGVKKGSLWRLTPSALRDGVISTTRYRKDPKRKPERRSSPALKRQISGAKGGQATRNATRRQQALREARSFPSLSGRPRHLRHQRRHGPGFLSPMSYHSHQASPQPHMLPHNPPASPYFLDIEETVPMPMSAPQTPPQVQLMYDAQPKSALSDFNFGHINFTNGGLIGDHDDFVPDTPSLATEASFMSEDGMQSLMSHNASREATSFPVDC